MIKITVMDVIIGGDYCPVNRVAGVFAEKRYESVLSEVSGILKDSAYSIVNLECPVVVQQAKPIDKCGPNLRCTEVGVEALKWAGFDCVTLANNHFYDFGEKGVNDTIQTLERYDIDYVGGGSNIDEASTTMYKKIQDKTLAIINCCEHEFSIADINRGGSNPLNVINQFKAIQMAKKSADFVIVIIHGGVELFWLPTKRMIETYRFFIDSGADAVVCHHQHCFSGYEVYAGKPIFYGLGNFCFDNDPQDYRWTSGYMVKLHCSDRGCIDFDLIPYRQCTNSCKVNIINGEEKRLFENTIIEYNGIIADDNLREQAYQQWCMHTESMFYTALNPLNNRLTSWIFKSPLGRILISKRKLLQQYNYLKNESHIERMRLAVERKILNY